MDYQEYESIYKLKKMIRNYHNYRELAEKGNMDSLCIAIDIDIAFEKAGLNEEEREAIKNCLLIGYSYLDEANRINKSKSWVKDRIWRGIIKMSVYLTTGKTIKTHQAKIRLQEIRDIKKKQTEELMESLKRPVRE